MQTRRFPNRGLRAFRLPFVLARFTAVSTLRGICPCEWFASVKWITAFCLLPQNIFEVLAPEILKEFQREA